MPLKDNMALRARMQPRAIMAAERKHRDRTYRISLQPLQWPLEALRSAKAQRCAVTRRRSGGVASTDLGLLAVLAKIMPSDTESPRDPNTP